MVSACPAPSSRSLGAPPCPRSWCARLPGLVGGRRPPASGDGGGWGDSVSWPGLVRASPIVADILAAAPATTQALTATPSPAQDESEVGPPGTTS